MENELEDWEIKRREELDKEVPHGCYDISGGGYIVYTGKQGWINYVIAMEKYIKT